MNELERLTGLLQDEAKQIEQMYPRNPCQYKSTQSLVLAYGVPFTQQSKSKFKGEARACYKNCYDLIGKHKNWHYSEGYATHTDLPLAVAHAWLVDERGAVIDPTWTDLKNEEMAYFGVVFTRAFVRKMALKMKVYGILEEDYRFGHELKQNGFPPGALHPLFHQNHA